MRPVWRAEWLIALRRRRLMVLNTLVPLALVTPIAWSAAPSVHASAVFAVLFTLFGTFGASIPLIRDGESGLLMRYALTGVHPSGLLLQRMLASTLLDLGQLAPSIAVIVLARGASATEVSQLLVAFALGLLTANVLGVWAAAIARSVAEGALFSAVGALLLLHVSGTFRSPPIGSWAARLEAWMPLRPLHESLLLVADPSSSAAPGMPLLFPSLVLVAVLIATGIFAGWVTGLSRPRSR